MSVTYAQWTNDPFNPDWLAVPKDGLPALIAEYVTLVSESETNEFCTCEWIVHPDDVGKTEKRRMRRGEEKPDCWIHTKQGFILGFFTWLFKVREERREPTLDDHIEAASDMLSSLGIDPKTGKRFGEIRTYDYNYPNQQFRKIPVGEQGPEFVMYCARTWSAREGHLCAYWRNKETNELLAIHCCTLAPDHPSAQLHKCPCGVVMLDLDG